MAGDMVNKFVVSLVVIVVAGFAGWLIQIAFPWVFQNSTGGYSSSAASTIVTNLPLIFLGLGLLVVIVYLLISAMNAAGHKK